MRQTSLALVVMLVPALTISAWALQNAPTGPTSLDGVYTSAQSLRGQAAYIEHCGECHQEDLSGPPALKGDDFIDHWREFPLEVLYSVIRTNMPPRVRRNPDAALPDATYLDILSYILEGNGYPAGAAELTAVAAESSLLISLDGPQPVPGGARVISVGCFVQDPDSRWILDRATEPRRTLTEVPDEVELGRSRTIALGTQSYRMANFEIIAEDFEPEPLRGHRVVAKGYLIRQPNAERINLTSLESVGPECGP